MYGCILIPRCNAVAPTHLPFQPSQTRARALEREKLRAHTRVLQDDPTGPYPHPASKPQHRPCRFVHRQDPERFAADCESTVGTRGDPTPAQAFGFGCVETLHRRAWERRAGKAHPMWPPGRPGSPACMTRHPAVAASRPAIAIKLVGVVLAALLPYLPGATLEEHAQRPQFCLRPLSLFQAYTLMGGVRASEDRAATPPGNAGMYRRQHTACPMAMPQHHSAPAQPAPTPRFTPTLFARPYVRPGWAPFLRATGPQPWPTTSGSRTTWHHPSPAPPLLSPPPRPSPCSTTAACCILGCGRSSWTQTSWTTLDAGGLWWADKAGCTHLGCAFTRTHLPRAAHLS